MSDGCPRDDTAGMRFSRLATPRRSLRSFGDILNGVPVTPGNVLQVEQCAQAHDRAHPACMDLATKAENKGLDTLGIPSDYARTALTCAQSGDAMACADALMKSHLTGIDLGIYTPEHIAEAYDCASSMDPMSDSCRNVAAIGVKYGLDTIPGGVPWGSVYECAKSGDVEACSKAVLKMGVAAGCTAISAGVAAPLCGPLASVVTDIIWPAVDAIFVKGSMALVDDIYEVFAGSKSKGCGGDAWNQVFYPVVDQSTAKFWEMVDMLQQQWATFLQLHGLQYTDFPYESNRIDRQLWEKERPHRVGTTGLFFDLIAESLIALPVMENASFYGDGTGSDTAGYLGFSRAGDLSGPVRPTATGWMAEDQNACLNDFRNSLAKVMKRRWDLIQKAYEKTLMLMSQQASEMAQRAMAANVKAHLSQVSQVMPGLSTMLGNQASIIASLGKKATALRQAAPAIVSQIAATQQAASIASKIGVAMKAAPLTTAAAKKAQTAMNTRILQASQEAAKELPVTQRVAASMASGIDQRILLGAGALCLVGVAAIMLTGAKK